MSDVFDTRQLVEELEEARMQPSIIKCPHTGRVFYVQPQGEGRWSQEEITLDNALEVIAPKIITQAVKVQDVASLMNYINRFKNADSAIFADIGTNTILGVIDYHTAANSDGNVDQATSVVPAARHTKHTASLTLPHSLEWSTWAAIDGRLMSHLDFSNHLEENSMDILPLGTMVDRGGNVVEDAPTTILELCRELQVRSTYGAAGEVRNGDYISVEMQKGDDVTTKKNVSLPVSIDLNIPVYFGEQAIHVVAFLRRRVEGGSLRLGIKLQRPEQARQDEFKRIVGEIEQGVELATLYGKPA